jgi:Flp pilus assembly protein TadB
MIVQREDVFLELKKIISREKKIIEEITSLVNSNSVNNTVLAHISSLKIYLKQENGKIPPLINSLNLIRILDNTGNEKIVEQVVKQEQKEEKKPKESFIKKFEEERKLTKEYQITKMEKNIIKRIENKKKETKKIQEKKKPNTYAGVASRIFSDFARPLVDSKTFQGVIADLLKTNIGLIPSAYISVIIFSTLIAFGASFLLFLFLLFFNVSSAYPFITPVTNIISRFLELFWMLFVIPILTFVFLYLYPSLERKSLEGSIDQELPFATINMSAIAGSRIEPTNIFNIIISTGEYPHLKNQFTKVMNEINIYGHDLVTALRDSADNCPSKKLSDLYNSLATNITSGGDLGEFFEKRSETLLLDYRLERERYTRASETFIDVYISIVIAAPMILMLLLMMIQVSGLGISLSPTTISLIMILGVAGINFVFLAFLRLKQPTK